jgi:hypothetical protein
MSQPSRRRHKARPGTPAVPVLSRTDWVRLSLILLVAGVLFVAWSAFELHLSHEASLSRILSRWRTEYHLTEEQERLIRAEEERFHGTAYPLTRTRRTPEEAEAHRLALGNLMRQPAVQRIRLKALLPTGQPPCTREAGRSRAHTMRLLPPRR